MIIKIKYIKIYKVIAVLKEKCASQNACQKKYENK